MAETPAAPSKAEQPRRQQQTLPKSLGPGTDGVGVPAQLARGVPVVLQGRFLRDGSASVSQEAHLSEPRWLHEKRESSPRSRL